MRGLRAQRCHPLVELILVDLAAGEPPGQDLLGCGRRGRGGWPGLAVRANSAGVAPVGRQQPLATPGQSQGGTTPTSPSGTQPGAGY